MFLSSKKLIFSFIFFMLAHSLCTGNTESHIISNSHEIAAGGIFDLSGPWKKRGVAAYRGAALAIKSINARVGFKERKIKFIVVDSACQPGRLLEGVDQLAQIRNMLFITGPSNPYFIKTLAGFTASRHLPLMVPSGNASAVRHRGIKYTDWTFRTTVDLSSSFKALLSKFQKSNIKKIGILVSEKNSGKDAMLWLRGYAPEYGIRISGVQQYRQSDADVMLQFREFKKAGSEVVILSGPARSMNVIAESALFTSMPLAVPVQMLSSEFISRMPSSLELWTALPPLLAGPRLSTSHPCAFAVQHFNINMADEIRDMTLEEKLAAGSAWDAVNMAAKAIQESDENIGRSGIRDKLEELEGGYTGVTGFFQPDQRDHSGLDPDSLIVVKVTSQ